ncbi:hypothetical protein SASPL_104374 [Salvia splendens]|uniref:Glycosyltransferase 2-like domain-containing protein n=1 Tax=Salvia splendens TaxID=180675 RepID=A0A8X8YLJ1_SALSN|nr:hypothetical protein SASPL_104374 [Salvia splendens]
MGETYGKILLPESYSSDIGVMWELMIVHLLTISVYIYLAMSAMVFIERVYMGAVILVVKLFGLKPQNRYKWEAIKDANAAFPMVLVQIPMCNEKEVYKISIGAASNLSWPSHRLLIQVLDDSTDLLIKDMIEKECLRWGSKGVNIRYQIRERQGGYKAGLLKQGLEHDYVKECEYVAIFDSDFRPEPDFLRRSVPFLIHKPVGDSQEAGSATHAFFGFNGAGGIWRIAAINDAGGWNDRTTVEDMDLAVRARLKAWKLLYLGDLQVYSELPSTFKAFTLQQHRWSSGQANLFRKTVMGIAANKNVMSFHRTKATVIGLVEAKTSNKWVMTEKLGDKLNNKGSKSKRSLVTLGKLVGERIHMQELGLAMFLFVRGCYDFLYGKNNYFVYLFLQVITFTIVGFGYIGTFLPTPYLITIRCFLFFNQ